MKVTKKITVKLHETNKKLISALLINLSVVVPTSIYAATGMVVNGTTFNAPAGTSIDTGTTTGWTGIALNVTNNGQVIAAGDIFLTTGGNSANTLAISGVGSNVVFSNGSTLTTTGDTAHGVYMTNNAHVTFDRADITTLGFFSSGINLLTGSTLQLTNSRITTSGNGGQAVVAVGSGLINIENTVITTTGNYQSGGAYGLHIANGSSGNLAGSQIKTSGSSSGAIFVETTNNAATTFVINDTILETAGDASIALAASELNGVGSSTVTLNGNNQIKTENGTGVSARGVGGKIIINAGTTITTKGTGVQATLNGGQVLMQGSTITTDKAGYGGMIADTGSKITATDVTVTTLQNNALGISAVTTGNIEATGIKISTSGNASHGVNIQSGGQIVLNSNDNKITAYGSDAYGVNVNGMDSKLNINDSVQIITEGDNGIGVYTAAGGGVNLGNGSAVKTSGDNSYGLYSTGINSLINSINASILTSGLDAHAVVAEDSGVIELSQLGGAMTSIQGTSLYSKGGTINATLDGVQIQNNGLLINVQSDLNNEPGTVSLVAKNLTMEGDIQADNESIANLTLENANWIGNAVHGNNFSINNKSVWTLSTDSDVVNLDNAGTIVFSAPNNETRSPSWSGRILTVHNQYVANDATLQLNTVLGNDQSITDRLVVEGDTSGTTRLHIVNQNGSGALTQNGINVVQVDGISAGQFNLANTVVAGAYEYMLVHKKLPNDTSSGWYLTSKLNDIKPIPVPPIVIPDTPIYRPDAGVNLSNQQGIIYSMVPGLGNTTTSAIGAGSSGSMRAASRLSGSSEIAGKTGLVAPQKSNSLWSFVSVNRTSGHTGKGQIDYSADTSILQVGTDKSFEIGDSLIQTGIMAAYGRIKTDSQNILTRSTGTGRVAGYSIGLYGTWYANKDSILSPYIDAYLTHGWYHNEVSTKGNPTAKYRSNVTSMTVQAGYPLALGSDIIVEPQAQVTYLHYSSKNYSDHTNTNVSNELKGNTIGRIGTYVYANNTRFKPYVALNIWYDNTNSIVKYNGVEMSSDKKGAILEAKLGFQAQATPDLTVWGEVGIRKGKHNFQDVGGSVGLKYRF